MDFVQPHLKVEEWNWLEKFTVVLEDLRESLFCVRKAGYCPNLQKPPAK